MRSVLDMKLGAMSGSLPSFSTMAEFESVFGSVEKPAIKDKQIDQNPNLNSENSPHDSSQKLDVFGIPIPKDANTQDSENNPNAFPFANVNDALSVSSVSDAACSVVLAESPSRLDLSALLC